MPYTVVVHVSNEDAFLGEMEALPQPGDNVLIVTNARRRDGKPLPQMDHEAVMFMYPWTRVNFLEVLAERSSRDELIEFGVGMYRLVLDAQRWTAAGYTQVDDQSVRARMLNSMYEEETGLLSGTASHATLVADFVAGSASEAFVEDRNERVKWALRLLYYRQSAFRATSGRYAATLDVLARPTIRVEGIDFNPVLQGTPSQYEISATGFDGRVVHINQDGRVWVGP